MIFSRLLSKKNNAPVERHQRIPRMPELDEFLLKRDYVGAISLLEFKLKSEPRDLVSRLWLGHCYFRAGEYKQGSQLYEDMLAHDNCPQEVYVYWACCLFYMGLFQDAKDIGERGPKTHLQNRLLFHAAHKLGDEKRLMFHHSQLQSDSLEDQLSLASIHFMRQHFSEAVSIYKSIVKDNTNMIALNVYLAMCYYHLEFFDVAKEMLTSYLKSFPDSPAALNLKCAILYRTYIGNNTPSVEIEKIPKNSLYPSIRAIIKHNTVVFKDGDGALQALPSILDEVPEARLNLIIYYIKHKDEAGALRMADELDPVKPMEFLVKAVAYAYWGTKRDSKDHLQTAERFFKMVGESTLEADTIPGRQSMAAHHFLCGRYDEALFYYESIAKFMNNDDNFLFNYGQCLLMCQKTTEAEEAFLSMSPKCQERTTPLYKYLLAKTLIMNKKADMVWDLYKQTTEPQIAFILTRIIANDGFKMNEYLYSALAYDNLNRMDPSPEHHSGLVSSAAGLFKDLIQKKKTGVEQQMAIIVGLLDRTGQSQAERVATTVRNWAERNGIQLSSPPDDDFP